MFIRLPNSYNSLESNIGKVYRYYRSTLNTLRIQHWNAEGIYGKGLCNHYAIGHYFNAMLYTVLLDLYIVSNKPTWAEIESKFEVSKMIKCFSCNNISLKHIFEIFGIKESGSGIESMGFEETYFIEENVVSSVPTINILNNHNSILANTYYINPILTNGL